MPDPHIADYSPLDVPEVLLRLFHPRPAFGFSRRLCRRR